MYIHNILNYTCIIKNIELSDRIYIILRNNYLICVVLD